MVARRTKKPLPRVANVTTDRPALTAFKTSFDEEIKCRKYLEEHTSHLPQKHKLTYEQAAIKAAKVGNILTFIQSVLATLPMYIDSLEELTKDKSEYDSKLRSVINSVLEVGGTIKSRVFNADSALNGLARDKKAHMEAVCENTDIASDVLNISLDCNPDGTTSAGKEVLIRMPYSLLNTLSINKEVWTANNVKIYGLPQLETKIN